MNTTHKILLTTLVFLMASCSSVSTDRTNDATAISASASGAYSDYGLTSNNILYFAYDRSDINSEGRAKIRTLAKLIKDISMDEFKIFNSGYVGGTTRGPIKCAPKGKNKKV